MFIGVNPIICKIGMICKIGKSLAEIENFLKEKYIQEMVLELRKAGNFIFMSCSDNENRVLDITTDSLEQAGAALVRFNLDDSDSDSDSDRFDIIKTYSDVTLAARSLKLHDGYLYFMEGSHYIYYPETQFRSNDMTIPRRVQYTGGSAATR